MIDALDTITLAELEGRDDLQRRVDYKYIVERETLERLLPDLGDFLVLDVDGIRRQRYDSTYFDTADLRNYRDHLQGRRKRWKARTRLYNDRDCFFDVKLRGRRGETVKRRVPHARDRHGVLTDYARAFLMATCALEYQRVPCGVLRPSLHTSFTRVSLVHASLDERVTIDFALTFESVGGAERYRLADDHALIETKSVRARGTADKLLPRLGAHPLVSCSKYCLGIAQTSDMPASPWRRIIRRYLDPEPVAA